MEQEFKWQADRTHFNSILSMFSHDKLQQTVMRAVYYDTCNGSLRSQKIGLRLRQENEQTVCCLKLRNQSANGLHVHAEYECPANDIADGLQHLPDCGAPIELCHEIMEVGVFEICQTAFIRQSTIIAFEDMTAELCLDYGKLICDKIQDQFTEIELELKHGDSQFFANFGNNLAKKHSLTPQPLSKLARALALANQ